MRSVHLGLFSLGMSGVIWSLLAAGSAGQAPSTQPVRPGAAVPGVPQAGAAPDAIHPLDQALAWMAEAKRNHGAVKDYTCTMVSQENVRGKLKEESVVALKFRVAPHSVYMRWLAPNDFRGQEVCYVHGKNNNQMRVHSKGILKIAGFVSVDPKDPRVMEHSRHTITEAGIGNLIDQTLKHWQVERKINRSETRIAEYDYNNRRCLRIESIRPERRPEHYAYRSVLFLDKDSKLPIRNESYDWPRQGGPATGDLLESYSYVDLQFNVGLTDRDFNK